MKMTAEESVLHHLGIDFHSPAPGCCGMAGSFGFEHDKYEISTAIGELELLPAVRNAPKNASSSPTASVVANKSPKAPAGDRCTSPKFCRCRCGKIDKSRQSRLCEI